MNSYNIITVTRGKGLRAVRGASFKLTRLHDGRHFIKCKRGVQEDLQIDAGLLTSSHAQVSHQDHPKTSGNGGAHTDWFVTLQSVGLAVNCDHKIVLVKPTPSDLPHTDALFAVHYPVLVWFPETEMTSGISLKVQWTMPGLACMTMMSSLWMEWKDPNYRDAAQVNIKVDTRGGECFLEEEEGRRRTNSRLTDYNLPL